MASLADAIVVRRPTGLSCWVDIAVAKTPMSSPDAVVADVRALSFIRERRMMKCMNCAWHLSQSVNDEGDVAASIFWSL